MVCEGGVSMKGWWVYWLAAGLTPRSLSGVRYSNSLHKVVGRRRNRFNGHLRNLFGNRLIWGRQLNLILFFGKETFHISIRVTC